MNKGGVPIARIAGIKITADWSVLVIGALLAYGVAAGAVPEPSRNAGLARVDRRGDCCDVPDRLADRS